MKYASQLAIWTSACALIGCAERVPFDIVPVCGHLSLPQEIPKGVNVTVYFSPENVEPVGDAFPRPAQGKVAPDGQVASLTTDAPGDGAIPGRYRVVLKAMGANYEPMPNAFPPQYTDVRKTPWRVQVIADRDNRFELTME